MAGLYHAMFNLEIPIRRLANENKELFQNDKMLKFVRPFIFILCLSLIPLESKKKIENKPQLEYLFLDLNRHHERLHSILFRFSG